MNALSCVPQKPWQISAGLSLWIDHHNQDLPSQFEPSNILFAQKTTREMKPVWFTAVASLPHHHRTLLNSISSCSLQTLCHWRDSSGSTQGWAYPVALQSIFCQCYLTRPFGLLRQHSAALTEVATDITQGRCQYHPLAAVAAIFFLLRHPVRRKI
jgi:hypothetical protein